MSDHEPVGGFSIGVIGLGGVSEAHFAGIAGFDWLTVRAVCDVNEARANEVAKRFECKAFNTTQAMLEFGGYDLVLVLTPASTHRSVVEAVAEYGFPILCEKPIAVTQADAQAIVDVCERNSTPFFYGSSYRYLPAILAAKELIGQGMIGDVVLMTEQLIGGSGIDHYQQLPPIHYPLGGPGGPGMGLVDHGIHLIDILPWLAGSKVVSASGKGQISGKPAIAEHVVFELENGALATLTYHAGTFSSALPNEATFSGGQGWLVDGTLTQAGAWEEEPGSISVYGTKGSLRILHYANRLYLRDSAGVREIQLSGRPAFGHFGTQIEHCAETLRLGKEPCVTAQDGLRALQTMLKIYE